MHVTVAGKQVATGEALTTHVRDGLAAIARKYFDHALEANVTFRRDRAMFACDINLKAGRNLFMRGEGEAPDAHRAFEVAADHVAKRLRRYRRRVNDHARSLADEREPTPAGRHVVLAAEPDDLAFAATPAEPGTGHGVATNGSHGAETDEDQDVETSDGHGVVIAEDPLAIARLTVGEAVMRLDLEHLPVLMFRNRGSDTLNVVYRRADGNVGWMDAR